MDACGEASLILAGHSFGGCVAYETAQRLIRSNYRVHFLGLIDAPFRLYGTKSGMTSWRNKLLTFCRNNILMYIKKLRSKGSIQGVLAEFRELLALRFMKWSVCRWPTPIARVFYSAIVSLLPPALIHSFKMRLSGALRIKYSSQWSPIALGVPITLFRSDDPQLGSERTYGWDEVCTSLTVVSIGGNHSTIFEQPQLDLLSSCFLKAINTLQRSGASNRETDFGKLKDQRSERTARDSQGSFVLIQNAGRERAA